MSTRTINLHGIDFTLAEADGEILDAEVEDAEEFLAHHGDDFGEGRLDEGYSADAMAKWAMDNLADDVRDRIDWPMWSQADLNGVSNRDFYFSTGWAR